MTGFENKVLGSLRSNGNDLERFCKMLGCTSVTFRRWLKQPDKMPFGAAKMINKYLKIDFSEMKGV